jgi:hypothetical protein
MRLPYRSIDEVSLVGLGQTGDQGGSQSAATHVVKCQVVQHVVGMSGTQQIEEVQPALGGSRAEPGEAVVADLRVKAVFGFMVGPALLSRKLMAGHEQLLTLASDIVSAHVSNNAVSPDQLPLRPIPGDSRRSTHLSDCLTLTIDSGLSVISAYLTSG